jgi:hypothetical protein
MEPQPEINAQIRETAKDIANKTALALKKKRSPHAPLTP